MAVDTSMPQSPGWWLARLGYRILIERHDLDRLWHYAVGEPKLPHVPGVDPLEVFEWMATARTNWAGLVIDAPAERLGVDGFRFGNGGSTGGGAADDDANRIWQENYLDADSDLVHYGALSQRRAFILVEKNELTGRPVLTHETPRQMAVEFKQGSRRELAAGLKMWRDDWTGQTRATLWLPDKIYQFGSKTAEPVFPQFIRNSLRQWDAYAIPGDENGESVNVLGRVPIVPFVNRRNRRIDGFAEHEDITPIQDRINLSLINLIAAMRYGAFRQRWAAGLEVDEDPLTGKKIEPFTLDIKSLWTTEDPDVKFGQFDATDLGGYIGAVESGVQDLAAISRTPPHYLLGQVVNVSGDALKAAETGLVSKVRDRQRNFGESWEEVIRLAFLVLGDTARAEAWDAETIWRDPESRSVSELADAAVKKASAGVPWRQRMADMGYTPAQIDRMEIDRTTDALLSPNPDFTTAQTVAVAQGQQPQSSMQPPAPDQQAVIGRGTPNALPAAA